MNCQISETRYLNVHTNILVHEFSKYQTLLLHSHRMEKLQRILRQKKVSQLSTGLLWLLTLAAYAQRRVIVVSLCVSWSVGRSVGISVRSFSLKMWQWWILNMDMWVCATGAQHSKSLEPRCQRTACLRRRL